MFAKKKLSMAQEILKIKDGRSTIDVDYNILYQAKMVLRALHHPLRRSLIETLEANKEMVVTDIYVKHRLEQSVASQHLAILRKAGIVNTRRDGKFIYYSLNKGWIKEVAELAAELAKGG